MDHYLSSFVVNHDIVWLDVSMHDTLAVTVFQCLQSAPPFTA